MAVKPIPDGYPRVIPYLYIDGAAAALDWYKDVFGATERMRMGGPDGKVGHAELEFGDGLLMLADEWEDGGAKGPKAVGGSPMCTVVYVEDVDKVFAKAIDAGATARQEVETKFYGDRSGMFEDPFGHVWSVMTHVEDVTPEEMERRMAQMQG
jgi:PhnB protein